MSLLDFFSTLYPINQGKGPGRRYISNNDIDILPAFPKGMKNNNVDVLIKEHSDFIGQILVARGLIGNHNKDKSELLVHGPIRNYANIVHYLPATEDDYYSAEGGLFRFGLECAFHSYRSSCAKIINPNLVETRIDSDIRWNHAAFLSGLYSEAIKTLSRINIYSIDGTPWHQGHEIFIEWMKGMRVASYQISWRQEPDEELATTVAARIIGQGIFGFLAAGEKNIITTFCDSLMNPNNTQNPLTGIVRAVRHKLINRDIEQNAAKYGVRRYGMHLEPWLIDTFRYLYNTHKWTVNTERSAIWYGRDGVYVTWPGSFGSLVEAFKETNVPFIPHGAAGLISVLHDSKIITGDGNELIYKIRIKDESGKERMNTAIRLASPDIVFYGKDYPDKLDYILEYGSDADNSSMPASVKESGGEGNDDVNKKNVSNNAAPNTLTAVAVIPNSRNTSIRPSQKHNSGNNQTDGSHHSSSSTASNTDGINLMGIFSTGAADDALPPDKADGSDSDKNSGKGDGRHFDAAPQVTEKADAGVSDMEPHDGGHTAVSGNEAGSSGDTGASTINVQIGPSTGAGDDALPPNKGDASGSDKNSGWSDAKALFDKLDKHSFGTDKGKGGRSDAAPQVAEKADVLVWDVESQDLVWDVESQDGDGHTAVSGYDFFAQFEQDDEGGGSLNNNTHNKSDASEPPVHVSAIDVNGDTNRLNAVKPADLEYARSNPRKATKGVSEGNKATIDIIGIFDQKE